MVCMLTCSVTVHGHHDDELVCLYILSSNKLLDARSLPVNFSLCFSSTEDADNRMLNASMPKDVQINM